MSQIRTDKFREHLGDFNTALLITRGGPTPFRARPMVIAGVDPNCDLWLVTSRDFANVHEIEKSADVLVTCQTGWGSCVCIAGRASLNHERDKLREFEAWLPLGVNDSDIVLIHVVGQHGEYWDNTGLDRRMYIYEGVSTIEANPVPDPPVRSSLRKRKAGSRVECENGCA
jgi:general stress protein 26